MREELIPGCLQEKILLSQPDKDLSVASKIALDTAAASRSFLSTIHHWMDNSASEPLLEQRCNQLCPALMTSKAL